VFIRVNSINVSVTSHLIRYVDDWDPGGRMQRRALRVVFINVPKSTLPTSNGFDAVLGPLLGCP
jgi:hypothetical protein